MIIVFADDQTVGVFPNIEFVRTACEAVDVEDGVYSFFDEHGRRLVPIIINLFHGRPCSSGQRSGLAEAPSK
jgi:hypothetical protein